MIRFYLRLIYYEIINFIYLFKIRRKNYHSIQTIFSNDKNLFNQLCIKYGTDKGFENFGLKKFYGLKKNDYDFCYPHLYSKFYNDLFYSNREKVRLVFECGIGDKTNKKYFLPGASLKVWRDYFPNATIYGADIKKELLINSKRINTFKMDQLNKKDILNVWKKIKKNKFDLIVDDGLHSYRANTILFTNTFKFLKKGGIYVIEDVLIQNILPYKKFLEQQKVKFEIIHFNNLNYSNHCLIKISK